MNIRRITSLTMLISFVFNILTSIVLYIVPHGRIAYWANWKLWGLTKTQWSQLHLNLGILLLLAGCLHIYYNWKPITAYLKNKLKKIKVFTVNFNIALIVTLIVGVGTYFHIPPMSTIINISESIKDAASIKYGEPPYSHAELSTLKKFTKTLKLDLSKSIELLKLAGVQLENDEQTINDIAEENNITPKQIHEIIKPASLKPSTDSHTAIPELPPPGFGRKKLAEICSMYNLDIDKLMTALSKKDITGDPDKSIKVIAEENSVEPIDIFEIIRKQATNC